ncbi:DUF3352 domain-containing protein [Luteococcus sp. Sow4_B9]|uniref:DUF3352 domain-containing protein n=1 Tax=Luteococcus sp. Sow4_B9 TaxID=3438792 RepID=UPI003F9D72F1
MTENRPPEFVPPQMPADAAVSPAPGQFETEPAKKSMSTGAKAGLAGLAALLAVGGGVAIADPFDLRKSGAESSAAVMPADVIGFTELNANPDLSQKAEMVRFAMKFPAFREKINLTEQGDLKQELWESMSKDSSCSSINYEADIKPWLGDRMGVAVREGAKDPIVAVEVSDEQPARDGIKKLEECSDSNKEMGVAYAEGYLMLAEDQGEADKAVTDAANAPLSKKAEFTEDFDKLGQQGIVNFWGTKEGLTQLSKDGAVGDELQQASGQSTDELNKQLEQSPMRSGAGTLRFTDGNPEFKVVMKSTEDLKSSTTFSAVDELPADTTVAIGLAGGQQLVDDNWDAIKKAIESSGTSIAEIEQQAQVKLPDDLKALLGDDFRVAVGPLDKQKLEQMQDPSQLPLSIASTGDKARITELVDKAGLGQAGATVEGSDKLTVVGLDTAWSTKVAKNDDPLEKNGAFKAAFAKPEQAQGGVFVNLDALKPLFIDGMKQADRENVEPLQAIGLTSHNEDANYAVATLRVTAK